MHSKEIKYYSLREEKEGGRSFQTTQQNIRLHINNRYKRKTAKSTAVQNSYKKNIIKIEERYSLNTSQDSV